MPIRGSAGPCLPCIFRQPSTSHPSRNRTMIPADAVAQDVAQEAWLLVHRFKAGWKQEAGSFGTWLYRIAWNALVAHHRLTKRRPLTLLDRDPEVAVYNDPIARMALQKAQERLSPAAMVAFTLGAVNGLDHNEMALVMDVTPDCARARLSRACRELRATLS